MSSEPDVSLTIRVLGTREDDQWCAIALDMSLRGYGETFDDALKSLIDAMEAQISFAVRHDTLDQIFVPAEPRYHGLYADIKRESMKRKLAHRTMGLTDYAVSDVPLPSASEDQFVAA